MRGYLDRSLSAGLQRNDDPRAVALAAEWELNNKGIAIETLAGLALRARNSDAANVKQAFEELRRVREASAALRYRQLDDSDLRRLATLMERSRQLTAQLGQSLQLATEPDPWIRLRQVRGAIPADSVLIDLARFVPYDFKPRGESASPAGGTGSARYVAWIIPSANRGEVELVDLGEAAKIEAAVKNVRRKLQAPADPAEFQKLTLNEDQYEADFRKDLEALAQLVLRPIEERVGTVPRWILSPDAQLWLIPWCALPAKDGRYLVEGHALQFVTSGRDLTKAEGPAVRSPALVVANPDFDLKPTSAVAGVRGVALAGLPRVKALPGTQTEANQVAPLLKQLTGVSPTSLFGPAAREAAFKRVQRPSAVVLCTHGFFVEEEPGTGPGLDNPLLRCGLLFAGCNQRGLTQDGDDDGIVTGLEIVGADLRGTRLAVLSACDTAVGVVHTGEGVTGLRQAFHLAGAQTVVASLWQVPDKETTQLMTGFFTHLAAGRSEVEALRQAQLSLIQERRTRLGAAHPYFWAAFTVTGK
jgi:CHAT domain-containing protein